MFSPKFEPEPDPPNSATRIPDVSGARFLPEASFRLHRKDWLDFAADDKSQRGGGGGGGGGGYGGGGGSGVMTMNPETLKKIVCFKCNQNGTSLSLVLLDWCGC